MLVRKGWTDQECADFFDISLRTLSGWKEKHPEFLQALKNWKESADYLVEKSLYDRAIGFKYDEITYEKTVGSMGIVLKDSEISEVKHVPTAKAKIVTKYVVPDVTAQIFWLKNRRPDVWRDKEGGEKQVDTKIIIIRDDKPLPLVVQQSQETERGRTISFNA
jgi:hypothetical protein